MTNLGMLMKKGWTDDGNIWYVDGVWMSRGDLSKELISKWWSSKDVESKRHCVWYAYGHRWMGYEGALLLMHMHNCLLPDEIEPANRLVEQLQAMRDDYFVRQEQKVNKGKSKKGGL